MIRFHPTPNPNSFKITSEAGPFLEAGEMASFASPEAAAGHRLGAPLFALPGVINIFILPQFLTITKAPDASWDVLFPLIEDTLAACLNDAANGSS